MQDLYLKFPSKSAADALLFEQAPSQFDSDGKPTAYESRQKYMNVDTVGTIYEGGSWDSEGNQTMPPKALPGWHVNVRLMPGEDATSLLPYAVTPTTPRRVWA